MAPACSASVQEGFGPTRGPLAVIATSMLIEGTGLGNAYLGTDGGTGLGTCMGCWDHALYVRGADMYIDRGLQQHYGGRGHHLYYALMTNCTTRGGSTHGLWDSRTGSMHGPWGARNGFMGRARRAQGGCAVRACQRTRAPSVRRGDDQAARHVRGLPLYYARMDPLVHRRVVTNLLDLFVPPSGLRGDGSSCTTGGWPRTRLSSEVSPNAADLDLVLGRCGVVAKSCWSLCGECLMGMVAMLPVSASSLGWMAGLLWCRGRLVHGWPPPDGPHQYRVGSPAPPHPQGVNAHKPSMPKTRPPHAHPPAPGVPHKRPRWTET